jgi:hypothetical protein
MRRYCYVDTQLNYEIVAFETYRLNIISLVSPWCIYANTLTHSGNSDATAPGIPLLKSQSCRHVSPDGSTESGGRGGRVLRPRSLLPG